MKEIQPIPTRENNQSFASLGYPALIALTTILTEACKPSSNDVQNLIPRGAAVITIVGAVLVISGAYLFLSHRNRK